ncbi:MAG: DUF3341 domain-containing protein [Nitrospinota bacterium]|nr:DUF3341 domain-containing protein [Nitrospinota bacterium]
MNPTVLALFEDIEITAKVMKPLDEAAIKHEDISLLTNTVYPNGALFHEEERPLWKWAGIMGFGGLGAGLFLAGFTQWLMNLNVGGKDPVSFPVVGVICYETTLLGIVLGSVIGMLWYGGMPDWTEKAYDPEISDGKIGVLVRCKDDAEASKIEGIMKSTGAVKIIKGKGDF